MTDHKFPKSLHIHPVGEEITEGSCNWSRGILIICRLPVPWCKEIAVNLLHRAREEFRWETRCHYKPLWHGPPPACPLRATPRGCHRASLPWLNLYYEENKWHTSHLLTNAAALWLSSQGLALQTCQKGISESSPIPDPITTPDLLHLSLWSSLRKWMNSEFPLLHTSFYQPYFLWYFVNYNKFAFFWIFRCFKRYPKDAIIP